jgi:hypothetical protein
MSETISWSFSTDRCVRRCQRQYFLQHVAAWHNSRDPIRREAFLLKQVKTLDLWQGSVVHRGIELFVVPAFREHCPVDWDRAITGTLAMAERQFAFSAARRYREPGMSKSKAGDDYCALVEHEGDTGVSAVRYQRVLAMIEASLRNLSRMAELLAEIGRADRWWSELDLSVDYDIARINVRMDLLFFRGFGKPTIVDWKVSESLGGSDADLQTALYAWAMCRHPKWRVERATDCELIEVQLLTQDVIRHRPTEETFDRLENRIYRSVDMIQALQQGRAFDLADIEDYDLAGNPNSCTYCPQRKLCQQLALRERSSPLGTEQKVGRSRTSKKRSHADACPQLF